MKNGLFVNCEALTQKVGAPRRETAVDDGAINKSHSGAENCGGEDPRPHFRRARCVSTHGPDYGFIARRFHEH
jgi:hypothetical protein